MLRGARERLWADTQSADGSDQEQRAGGGVGAR
jgi:hypothetical protein